MNQNFEAEDVYTIHQLEQLGDVLSSRHQQNFRCRTNTLLIRLKQNEDLLRNTYKLVTAFILEGHKTTPAGEWLLDNFHVIEEQIRTSKIHLPKKFSLELPMIDDPSWKCQPRIYIIARELINHTDGRLDQDAVNAIISSYQKKNQLCLGELWAFPIMLRLALIENLRQIAEQIVTSYIDRRNATFWAERISKSARHEPHELIGEIADLARSAPRLSSSFVSEFARLIQLNCLSPTLPLGWIEQQLGSQGLSIDKHRYLASQNQAHDQMSISNSIASLRFLNEIDWRKFVESMSGVEDVLKRDPAGTYSAMDFPTRDAYRHVIEYLSRFSEYDEVQVANIALELTKSGQECANNQQPQKHIGEYLLGPSRRILEKKLRVRRHIFDQIRCLISDWPLVYYFGLLGLLIPLLLWYPLHAIRQMLEITPWVVFMSLLMALCASQTALAVTTWLTTLIVKPKPWARMDFSHGVPSTARTIVAIPSMLSSISTIDKLLLDLEVRYLGNKDPNILFALLSDFVDAESATKSGDDILLGTAQDGIKALNEKYAKSEMQRPFYLFHRPRLWNSSEKIWMGYERKRGKLSAFNSFLRGGAKDRFISVIGDLENLHSIRYVITLDADSILPRETAGQLIAAMAHPLNHPVLDVSSRVVKQGYAILQPRVTIHLQDSGSSRFMRLFSDDFGIDPYTKSVSDVYQDLFREGSFIGKGIYDLDAFQKALEFRFPENRVLSHDLVESGFARSGLVSDVQIFEEFPSGYCIEASRRHRWIRGDWQIASWILPKVSNEAAISGRNPLSALSRWKIFDNLRRSLNPISTFAILYWCWSVGSQPGNMITWWIIACLSLPEMLQALNIRLWWYSPSLSYRQVCREQAHLLLRAMARSLLGIAFLSYDAYLAADAILRSLYRMVVSRRQLLQWQTAAESHRTAFYTPIAYLRLMWFAPLAALIGATTLVVNSFSPGARVSLVICAGWFLSPFIAWWLSQPLLRKIETLSLPQVAFLRSLARRTWLFFETFVTDLDNNLPPDNFQEYPFHVIAHRTSPTNIGLGLLSTLGAFDFGYLSLHSLTAKVESTLDSLEKMERFKGHFYNWYDTQNLKPLLPLYVSTVDSGNLAGYLLALRQGLNQLADGFLRSDRIFEGLEDVLFVIQDLTLVEKNIHAQLQTRISELKGILCDQVERQKSGSKYSLSETTDKLGAIKIRAEEMHQLLSSTSETEAKEWVNRLILQIVDHSTYLISSADENDESIRAKLRDLASRASEFLKQDYSFLYNEGNKLLAIGYNVGDSRRDQSYYDLLASEARLASFLAIAQGYLPQEHWFALGRQLTRSTGPSTLLSWSGSMFEYLMPLLILPSFEGTLLDQSCRQCVRRQIEYGSDRHVAWGISESGYNITDAQYNYQYRAFGVPGLGLKPGLEKDLVVAPYAAVMAIMLDPCAACANLEQMHKIGYSGIYGFYESIDFTPIRLPAGEDHVIIRSFMAHHQGMAFLSLLRFLLDQPMQKRMQSEPMFKATELLLHERIPKAKSLSPDTFAESEQHPSPLAEGATFRIITDPSTTVPDVHLLGNGHYHVMISAAGAGYSTWNNLSITRWRQDRTQDASGYFIYIHDERSKKSWSVGFQPLLKIGKGYEVIFSEGRAEFKRTDNELDTHTEIAVSPDENIELRRLTLSNRSKETRFIEVTTYGEIVLAPMADDLAHPAFSNLFVQTEIFGSEESILAHRRAREPDQSNPWLYHAMVVHGMPAMNGGAETDRAQFIGRNLDLTAPLALTRSLTHSSGPVLDPIFSIRKRITIQPEGVAVIDCILGICENRSTAIDQIERFKEKQIADRVLELAWTHGHVLLQQINCSPVDAMLYGKIAASLLYGGSALRCDPATVKANIKPRSAFWSYGISGDLPILLLRLQSEDGLKILQQIVKGHDYWRRKGLAIDLVIWNESRSSYRQELHDRIAEVIAMSSSNALLDKSAGIFVRRPLQMPDEDRLLFQSAARVILSEDAGPLEDQVNSIRSLETKLPPILQPRIFGKKAGAYNPPEAVARKPLELFADNGLGGFCQDTREYVIRMSPGTSPPRPWVNVIANAHFGTLVSESGSSYTWSENAHEHRLTPWFNDPLTDPSGEAVYIRDEQNAGYWSATPGPRPAKSDYEVRHGFGYSSFATKTEDISSLMTVFVAKDAPVKFILLKLENQSGRQRQLSITCYFELVLGELRSKTESQIVTESDPAQGLIFGRNVLPSDFPGRVAFLGSTEAVSSLTGDRSEFIGRNRSVAQPAAMDRLGLSGWVGALQDPCLALQIKCDLAPGTSKDIAFVFGAGSSYEDARRLGRPFRSIGSVHIALAEAKRSWNNLLQRIQVDTPDPALNHLANGWLLYQTISSRIWGRTGFYQSGGAYGFRDQLQDMMAVVYCAPGIVREHILRCAGRQFAEGDVQHWWHPPMGRGVRTTISDDYLWLPYVTAHYIKVTADWGILDESISYLQAKALEGGQESDYSLPIISEERGSLYEHCVRALNHGFKFGIHGLPLMGSGDWNDGMNRVGIHGKGESVWLGFFLLATLENFSAVSEHRIDHDFASTCNQYAGVLKKNLEGSWDGAWYRRAYFDDGTPLGSADNEECRIDSLPQSWAVLSGQADGRRARESMESVYEQLVQHETAIIQLFTPPFNEPTPNPGYISGYLPGIRENGGQYTHAALWVVLAFAKLGEIDRALELLSLINPIHHSDSPEGVARYKVEPYVVAADVYATAPHSGRGGWTWYTGSSAWFYRAILETFLGFDLNGDRLNVKPLLPKAWQGYRLRFQYRETPYHIEVVRSFESRRSPMAVDGLEVHGPISLVNDHKHHHIRIEFFSEAN